MPLMVCMQGAAEGTAGEEECWVLSCSTLGMAPCSRLPDQEDAIATQVCQAPMAPGEVGTLPWGARPEDAAMGCQAWGPTALGRPSTPSP